MHKFVSLLLLQSSILAEEERELVVFHELSSCCLVAAYGTVDWFAVCDCGTCNSW